jgi:hypothetical protein
MLIAAPLVTNCAGAVGTTRWGCVNSPGPAAPAYVGKLHQFSTHRALRGAGLPPAREYPPRNC